MRLESTREIMASKKRIDDLWKNKKEPLIRLINDNKRLMNEFLTEQERLTALEIKKDGYNKKESQELAKIETKENIGISYRKDYEIEIIDINQVPEKYIVKELNDKEVKSAIKDGITKISGLKWKEIRIIINK